MNETRPLMLRRIVLALCVLLAPIVVVSILLWTQLDATLLQHAPYWGDELYHWHQSATLATVGLDGGYYTLDENIPLAEWSHYYAWGIYSYMPYALVMRVFGIGLTTLQFTNLAAFSLAMIGFMLLVRPDEERYAWLIVIAGSFIPLVTYLPSSMLQLMNLAVALVIAGGFYRLLTGRVSLRFVVLMSGFLLLAGLLRPTWTIFVLPMLILWRKDFSWKTAALAFGIAVPLTLLAAYLFYTSTSPFPHFRTRLFLGDATTFDKIISFLEYIQISIGWLFTDGPPIAHVQRIQVLVLLVALVGWGIWNWRSENTFEAWGWEWLFHGFNLLGFYVLTLTFHEVLAGHDYRVMSPHVFISLLVFVAMRRRLFLVLALLVTIPFFGYAVDNYNEKVANFNGIVSQEYAQWRPSLADALPYDATIADNAWCHTVVMSSLYTLNQGPAGVFLAVPPGYGISWIFDWDESGRFSTPETFSSRFMILTQQDADVLSETVDLRRIGDVAGGTLYLNADSACPS